MEYAEEARTPRPMEAGAAMGLTQECPKEVRRDTSYIDGKGNK